MMREDLQASTTRRTLSATARMLVALQLDGPLLVGLGLVCIYGLVVLYSASGQSLDTVLRTLMRIGLGALAMIALAHTSANFLRRLAPWLFVIGILLLIVVDVIGYVGKGAQRWLDLGLMRFQPSEIMKLAVPMLAAWFLHERPLPPDWRALLIVAGIILLPAGADRHATRPRHGAADHRQWCAAAADGGPAGVHHRRPAAHRRRRRRRRLALPARLPAPARADLPQPRDPTRWAPATTSSSRRSRSAPAGCSARAG